MLRKKSIYRKELNSYMCVSQLCARLDWVDVLHYLLFSIVIWTDDALNDLDNNHLDALIHHLLFDWFIICFEFLLDALELDTFYDDNCKVDSDNFNASKIIEKYEGLTQQLRWEILMILIARSLRCHHLFSLESISARQLSHILWKT